MALIEHLYPLFAALSIPVKLQCFGLVCALCMSSMHLCVCFMHVIYAYIHDFDGESKPGTWKNLDGCPF